MYKLIKSVKRYVQLEVETIKYCLMREIEYRFNFVITFFAVFTYQMSILFTYSIIYYSTGTIGGWNYTELSLLFATNAIVENVLFMPFVFYNLFNLPNIINNGDLDFILIKPVSTVFYVSFKRFDFGTFVGGLISAIIYYITAIPSIVKSFSIVNLIMYILLIFNGFIIMFSLFLLFQCLGFYFIKVDVSYNLFWAIHQFGKKAPGLIYPYLLQLIMTFIIPVLVISYYPSGISLNKLGGKEICISYIATATLFFVSIFVWNRSIKRYYSASS